MTRVLAAVVTAVPLALSAQGAVDLSKAKLKNPATFTEKAPDTFKAKFETSKGTFVVTVHRAWAPLGADRFYNLVRGGFYDECRFFRVIDGLVAPIFSTTSMPCVTSPKIVWWLSRCGVGPSVMKNWPPLVLGPAFAIERMPALV